MDLFQLKYFQTVARTGNISRAAKELFASQPNLSKRIAQLEDELGVPLFDHRKGKITLNEYGRSYLAHVEEAFSQLETGAQTVRRMYESNQNILSLACNINDFLPDALTEFSGRYPDVGIRQLDCPMSGIIERLTDRSLDLAVTSEPIREENLVCQLLGRKEFVILVGSGHPLSGQASVSIPALRGERFICDSSRLRIQLLRRLCQEYGGFDPAVPYEVQSTELIFRLLEANRAIAFMPISQVAKLHTLHPGSCISMVRVQEPIPPAYIGVCYHKNYVFSQSAECFLAFLRQWLRQEEETLSALGYDYLT